LEDRIAVMVGGRAAEGTVYKGIISTGVHNDLERATEMARQASNLSSSRAKVVQARLTQGEHSRSRPFRIPVHSDEELL